LKTSIPPPKLSPHGEGFHIRRPLENSGAGIVSSHRDNRKLARHIVSGASQNEIMSCRRRAVAALWRAAQAERDTGIHQPFYPVPHGTNDFIQPSTSHFVAGYFPASVRDISHEAGASFAVSLKIRAPGFTACLC